VRRMEKLLKEVVPQIRKVIFDLNGDVLIVVTGVYGSGKTTLSMMLARAIWDRFSFREHMTYSLIDFLKLLRRRRVKVILQDEGKRLGKVTDFMRKEVKYLENVLSESRKLNKCVIINIGELHRLFKWLANERAAVWIHVFKRGKAMIFQARNYIMDGNRFGVNKDTFKNVKSEMDLFRRLTSLPSFCFIDSFPQYHDKLLPEKEFKEYEEMARFETIKYIDEIIDELEEEKDKKKTKINFEEVVSQVYQNADRYLKTWGKRTFIDTKKIEADFDIGYTRARKIKAKVEDMLRKEGRL